MHESYKKLLILICTKLDMYKIIVFHFGTTTQVTYSPTFNQELMLKQLQLKELRRIRSWGLNKLNWSWPN
jgi:hypothetical protein